MSTSKSFYVATISLATVCFSFNDCNADLALIESICKQSQDYNFCMQTLGADPRSVTADIRKLAMISVSLAIMQIQSTQGQLPDIVKRTTDPLAIKRLGVCQKDYDASLDNFRRAFDSLSKSTFDDTMNFVRDGTNQVIDCHNIFRRDGPIATSPIAGDDINVTKYTEFILIAIDRLLH